MGGLFARSGSAPGTPPAATTATSVAQTSPAEKGDAVPVVPGQMGEAVAVDELRAFLRRATVKRFVECGDAGKVRVGEVEELFAFNAVIATGGGYILRCWWLLLQLLLLSRFDGNRGVLFVAVLYRSHGRNTW